MQISTLKPLVKRLARFVNERFERWLGLRVLRAESFYRVVSRIIDTEKLRETVAKQERELEELRTIASPDLKSYMRMIEDLAVISGTLVRRQFPKPDNLGSALIVVTSVSQIPHLTALVTSSALGSLNKVVLSFVDVDKLGLRAFCEVNTVTLIDHAFRLIVGDATYCRFEEGELWSNLPAPYSFEFASPTEREPMLVLDQLIAEVRRLSVIRQRCTRVIRHFEAAIMILFEDNAGHDTGMLAATARSFMIPTAIIPFTIADELEPLEGLYRDSRFNSGEDVFNKLAAIRYPHWYHAYRDTGLVRRPGVIALAAEAVGSAPPSPWILNSTRADAIAVESTKMLDHYRSVGIPESQLVLTGSVMDDVLLSAQKMAADRKHRLGLRPDKPVLLCSFPPNQLDPPRPECEIQDYRLLIQYWMEELGRLKDWQVVVKPHPVMEEADIDYLREFPVTVSEAETADLIPLCDLYNTSVSSTIRWALACGKPVLNFDVFRYGYRDFAKEPAVVTVSSLLEFSREVQQLATNPARFDHLREPASAAAPNWGMLDGLSSRRIGELFSALIEGRLELQDHAALTR